jgi:hypothetical protein
MPDTFSFISHECNSNFATVTASLNNTTIKILKTNRLMYRELFKIKHKLRDELNGWIVGNRKENNAMLCMELNKST